MGDKATIRDARERALAALCDAESRHADPMEALEESWRAERIPPEPAVAEFAEDLVVGVWWNRPELDGKLEAVGDGWSVAALSPTVRNLLRLAAFELGNYPDARDLVIAEAGALARGTGDDSSAGFVAGVLGRLPRSIGADASKLKGLGRSVTAGFIQCLEAVQLEATPPPEELERLCREVNQLWTLEGRFELRMEVFREGVLVNRRPVRLDPLFGAGRITLELNRHGLSGVCLQRALRDAGEVEQLLALLGPGQRAADPSEGRTRGPWELWFLE